jgi:hypothetical protein
MSRYAILRRAKQITELNFYRKFGNVGSQTTPSMNPLHGIRVLDMSRILAGPYCSMILGDLGAEIVKVEQPAKETEIVTSQDKILRENAKVKILR